jgi:hypothetical protein
MDIIKDNGKYIQIHYDLQHYMQEHLIKKIMKNLNISKQIRNIIASTDFLTKMAIILRIESDNMLMKEFLKSGKSTLVEYIQGSNDNTMNNFKIVFFKAFIHLIYNSNYTDNKRTNYEEPNDESKREEPKMVRLKYAEPNTLIKKHKNPNMVRLRHGGGTIKKMSLQQFNDNLTGFYTIFELLHNIIHYNIPTNTNVNDYAKQLLSEIYGKYKNNNIVTSVNNIQDIKQDIKKWNEPPAQKKQSIEMVNYTLNNRDPINKEIEALEIEMHEVELLRVTPDELGMADGIRMQTQLFGKIMKKSYVLSVKLIKMCINLTVLLSKVHIQEQRERYEGITVLLSFYCKTIFKLVYSVFDFIYLMYNKLQFKWIKAIVAISTFVYIYAAHPFAKHIFDSSISFIYDVYKTSNELPGSGGTIEAFIIESSSRIPYLYQLWVPLELNISDRIINPYINYYINLYNSSGGINTFYGAISDVFNAYVNVSTIINNIEDNIINAIDLINSNITHIVYNEIDNIGPNIGKSLVFASNAIKYIATTAIATKLISAVTGKLVGTATQTAAEGVKSMLTNTNTMSNVGNIIATGATALAAKPISTLLLTDSVRTSMGTGVLQAAAGTVLAFSRSIGTFVMGSRRHRGGNKNTRKRYKSLSKKTLKRRGVKKNTKHNKPTNKFKKKTRRGKMVKRGTKKR